MKMIINRSEGSIEMIRAHIGTSDRYAFTILDGEIYFTCFWTIKEAVFKVEEFADSGFAGRRG